MTEDNEHKKPKQPNYIKNTSASQDGSRTLRIEVIGGVSDNEKKFLDGISFFVAGTLSRSDKKHIVYVSRMMSRLVKHVVSRLKQGKALTLEELKALEEDEREEKPPSSDKQGEQS